MVANPIHPKSNPLFANGLKLARSDHRARGSRSRAPTLRWVEPFSLDVPLLDDQHRQLLEQIQMAIAAIHGRRERKAAQVLESLKDTAQGHFNDEEILMCELEYPGYVNHVEQHRRLVLRLEHLQARLALRRVTPQQAIYDLRSWFALHLIDDDAAFAGYFNGRRHRTQGMGT